MIEGVDKTNTLKYRLGKNTSPVSGKTYSMDGLFQSLFWLSPIMEIANISQSCQRYFSYMLPK